MRLFRFSAVPTTRARAHTVLQTNGKVTNGFRDDAYVARCSRLESCGELHFSPYRRCVFIRKPPGPAPVSTGTAQTRRPRTCPRFFSARASPAPDQRNWCRNGFSRRPAGLDVGARAQPGDDRNIALHVGHVFAEWCLRIIIKKKIPRSSVSPRTGGEKKRARGHLRVPRRDDVVTCESDFKNVSTARSRKRKRVNDYVSCTFNTARARARVRA